jgi:hypothetical protein
MVPEYEELGVDRLVVHLGNQKPERVSKRLIEMEKFVTAWQFTVTQSRWVKHMKDFGGKLAVITGGGNGMGRELARQLVAGE